MELINFNILIQDYNFIPKILRVYLFKENFGGGGAGVVFQYYPVYFNVIIFLVNHTFSSKVWPTNTFYPR